MSYPPPVAKPPGDPLSGREGVKKDGLAPPIIGGGGAIFSPFPVRLCERTGEGGQGVRTPNGATGVNTAPAASGVTNTRAGSTPNSRVTHRHTNSDGTHTAVAVRAAVRAAPRVYPCPTRRDNEPPAPGASHNISCIVTTSGQGTNTGAVLHRLCRTSGLSRRTAHVSPRCSRTGIPTTGRLPPTTRTVTFSPVGTSPALAGSLSTYSVKRHPAPTRASAKHSSPRVRPKAAPLRVRQKAGINGNVHLRSLYSGGTRGGYKRNTRGTQGEHDRDTGGIP